MSSHGFLEEGRGGGESCRSRGLPGPPVKSRQEHFFFAVVGPFKKMREKRVPWSTFTF